MHKDIQEEMLEELMESANRFTDIPAYLQFIDEAIQGQKEMEALKTMPQKMLFRLCLFITQKVLNFHASFTWSERWYSAPHFFFKRC